MSDINIEATAHPLAKYRNHLEFNGYQVQEEDDKIIVATHPRKQNLSLQGFPERGVYVCAVYSFLPGVERGNVLEYINELNSQLMYLKAYVDEENNLVLETFYEGDYDRKNFSILLENIEDDWQIITGHELSEEYLD